MASPRSRRQKDQRLSDSMNGHVDGRHDRKSGGEIDHSCAYEGDLAEPTNEATANDNAVPQPSTGTDSVPLRILQLPGEPEMVVFDGHCYGRTDMLCSASNCRIYRCAVRACQVAITVTDDYKHKSGHPQHAHASVLHKVIHRGAVQLSAAAMERQIELASAQVSAEQCSPATNPHAGGNSKSRPVRRLKRPKRFADYLDDHGDQSGTGVQIESCNRGRKKARKDVNLELLRSLRHVCEQVEHVQREVQSLKRENDNLRRIVSAATNHKKKNEQPRVNDVDVHVDVVEGAAKDDKPDNSLPWVPLDIRERHVKLLNHETLPPESFASLAGQLASSRKHSDGRRIFYDLPQNRGFFALERVNQFNAKGEKVVTCYHRSGKGFYRCKTCRKFNVRVESTDGSLKFGSNEIAHESRCPGATVMRIAVRDLETIWRAYCVQTRVSVLFGLNQLLSEDPSLLLRIAASYFMDNPQAIRENLSTLSVVRHRVSSQVQRLRKKQALDGTVVQVIHDVVGAENDAVEDHVVDAEVVLDEQHGQSFKDYGEVHRLCGTMLQQPYEQCDDPIDVDGTVVDV